MNADRMYFLGQNLPERERAFATTLIGSGPIHCLSCASNSAASFQPHYPEPAPPFLPDSRQAKFMGLIATIEQFAIIGN
jgi:hypothetical protein